VTPLDETLADALYRCPGVTDVYRLSRGLNHYPKFDDIQPFRWAVALSVGPASRLVAAQLRAARVLGHERMCWITFLDGTTAVRGPLLRSAERLAESVAGAVQGEQQPPPLSSEERTSLYGGSEGHRDVLIVSDSSGFMARVCQILPGPRVASRYFADGYKKALAMLQDRTFDLVLVDGAMVGMHAAMLCEWVALQRPGMFPRVRVVLAGAPDSVRSRIVMMRIPTMPALDGWKLAQAIEEVGR
jgi:CheY-like chemotaxis protein